MAAFEYSKWSVQRSKKAPLLDFIIDGLKASGCTILWASEPSHAPFLVSFETAFGERHGVLIYAFFANSKLTANRPADEHRFQIKYGSDTKASLPVEFDPSQLVTTVFVGIDTERGIMVGADPVLHDGTKMFISLEIKRKEVDTVLLNGWHAWERESSRRVEEPVEVLVGVKQERVLDFIRFERLAVGLDAGHRQLLAEQLLRRQQPSVALSTGHALTSELRLSEGAILDLIQNAKRLKMAVRGWVAEHHLESLLQGLPGVTECRRLDEEGRPDIELRFNGARPILIECKNVLRQPAADGTARVDFQRTRASKSDPCSRYYQPGDFNVLAACLHAVTENWDYRFILTRSLPQHHTCGGRIQSSLRVSADWYSDPIQALAAATANA